MNSHALIAALVLPDACRVDRRVPKKLLAEHAAFGAEDRKAILERVDELAWLYACKPGNLGVPAYRDETREYLEIAVLRLRARDDDGRLLELVHRSVPYPVVLLAEQGGAVSLSLAHKRWSLGEAGRVVLEGGVVTVRWDATAVLAPAQAAALAWRRAESMLALYQGWMDAVFALLAEGITGRFALPLTAEAAALRRQALAEREVLLGEIARRTAEAERETQMAQLVALNEEVRGLRARLVEAESRL
ncbi:MAG: DUF4391 domain-containing protein [Deltaproteobacteria bacterium]|nr:DUF4391 domain-containing protein [Deltaproteobacteria bacterium]